MIAGLDSSGSLPSAAQLAAAKAAGVRMWNGYLPEPGIAANWSRADFARVKAAGLATLAYCSGRADPADARAQGAAWGVPICLDVESGIRADGGWVQQWLDASGAGLYGAYSVHPGRRAAFHVMAGYPGSDPGVSWPHDQPRPSTPCGWQFQGSHMEFACTVDRGWFDDAFANFGLGPTPPSQGDDDMLIRFVFNGGAFVTDGLSYRHITSPTEDGDIQYWTAKTSAPYKLYAEPLTEIACMGLPLDRESADAAGDTRAPLGGDTAALAGQLAALAAAVAKISGTGGGSVPTSGTISGTISLH